MIVIKRDGSKVPFEKDKITIAITKAMDEVEETCDYSQATKIAESISKLEETRKEISIYDIEDMVEDKLMASKHKSVARHYIKYRYSRELARKFDLRDENILKIIKNENEEAKTENSNKDTALASTQRDYIASEVCKDLAKRVLIPSDIVKAHEEGLLHWHDMDYSPAQNSFNCCLINIKDMLDNGTCINKTMVESPHTFSTACTITTQIIASVASSQFGGQSVNIKHLGKYLKLTYEKYLTKYSKTYDKYIGEDMARSLMMEDLTRGVQTIQYQINTISCTDG